MGNRIVVVGTFEIEWDADQLRSDWGEPNMTDEQLLAECQESVQQDWASYATTPNCAHIEGFVAE